jgi:hypothetical protein
LALGLVLTLAALLAVCHLVGCGGGGGGALGCIYGYAFHGDGVTHPTSALACYCDDIPPAGLVPAIGFTVHLDSLGAPASAVTNVEGYWSVCSVTPGRHTVYIVPPPGAGAAAQVSTYLVYEVRALGSRYTCEPSHEGGGG